MRKAEREGRLSGLAGEGKRLPERPEAALVDTGTAVGHRIMAEAGALPREIHLKKRMQAPKDLLAGETDTNRRKEIMAKLAEVQM